MKLRSIILTLGILNSTFSYAECNLGLDIKRVDEGFLYTADCHRLVGKTFLDKRDLEKQITQYEDLLPTYKEQVKLEAERAELWRSTSFDLNKRVQNMEKVNEKNKLMYFGAGVALMLAASWAAGQAN